MTMGEIGCSRGLMTTDYWPATNLSGAQSVAPLGSKWRRAASRRWALGSAAPDHSNKPRVHFERDTNGHPFAHAVQCDQPASARVAIHGCRGATTTTAMWPELS